MTGRAVLLTTNLARGGAETQVAQLAAALRRRGWETGVVSLVRPSAFESELASAGVPVFSLDMRPGKADPRALARFASLLRKLRPHVLHCHMFHANLLGRGMRLIFPIPAVISTAHSVIESSRRSPDARRHEWLYRLTDRLADATVCVCAAGAERYAAIRAASPGRLRVIPNCVDTTRFRPDADRRARTRQALGLQDEFAWLAVGRLMWKKDYPTMIGAMARQRNAVLFIAGTGEQETELRALVSRLGANVRFLGAREDIPELMNASDGLALSSVVEGLPVVLLEASSSGLPSVATGVGGVPEAVLDERTGYVAPPGDPAAFAAAMSRLADLSPEARREMGRRAREHALACFDVHAVAARWEELYRQLLA